MTPVTRRFALQVVVSVLVFARVGAAQYPATNTITSNRVDVVGGCGDTIWILTSLGVNYTTNARAASIHWEGYKDVKGWAIGFGAGHALICLTAEDYATPNDLWLYSHAEGAYRTVSLDYNVGAFLNESTVEYAPVFLAWDAAWHEGSFWVACADGGVAQVSTGGRVEGIFYPGRDTVTYSFGDFTPDKFPDLPNSVTRARGVAPDSQGLWVMCEGALWRLDLTDSTWGRVNDSVLGSPTYSGIAAQRDTSGTTVYAIVSRSNREGDTSLCAYDASADMWHTIAQPDSLPSAMALGAGGRLYTAWAKEMELYDGTLPDSALPIDSCTACNPILTTDDFRRIKYANSDIDPPAILDIYYAVAGNDTMLWIATENGVYYSLDEHADEANAVPFTYESRKVPVASNLDRVYAVPSIINDLCYECVFVYNLATDDHVTIDIYDYNMDHVVRIIDGEFRKAGKNRKDGRSTVPIRDRWDGTMDNRNGRPVAAGVYYFRIRAEEGMRAFGKIIVAGN